MVITSQRIRGASARTTTGVFLLGCFMWLGLAIAKEIPAPPPPIVIQPGASAGPIILGRERPALLDGFALDDESPQPSGCGVELNWVDIKNPKKGNLFIWLRNDKVFQVGVATDRYHTVSGVAVGDSPAKVRTRYKHLRAYVLSDITSEAFGMRPLIYWVDRETGIAFVFAYSKTINKRYLYQILIFHPHSDVCPMDDSANAAARRELAPYSLEPSSR